MEDKFSFDAKQAALETLKTHFTIGRIALKPNTTYAGSYCIPLYTSTEHRNSNLKELLKNSSIVFDHGNQIYNSIDTSRNALRMPQATYRTFKELPKDNVILGNAQEQPINALTSVKPTYTYSLAIRTLPFRAEINKSHFYFGKDKNEYSTTKRVYHTPFGVRGPSPGRHKYKSRSKVYLRDASMENRDKSISKLMYSKKPIQPIESTKEQTRDTYGNFV